MGDHCLSASTLLKDLEVTAETLLK